MLGLGYSDNREVIVIRIGVVTKVSVRMYGDKERHERARPRGWPTFKLRWPASRGGRYARHARLWPDDNGRHRRQSFPAFIGFTCWCDYVLRVFNTGCVHCRVVPYFTLILYTVIFDPFQSVACHFLSEKSDFSSLRFLSSFLVRISVYTGRLSCVKLHRTCSLLDCYSLCDYIQRSL